MYNHIYCTWLDFPCLNHTIIRILMNMTGVVDDLTMKWMVSWEDHGDPPLRMESHEDILGTRICQYSATG